MVELSIARFSLVVVLPLRNAAVKQGWKVGAPAMERREPFSCVPAENMAS